MEPLIDNFPNKLPMRMDVDVKGKTSRKYSYTNYGDIYHEISKFLKGHIGQNFDKVFSKFCKKYPKSYQGVNTRAEFLKRFPTLNVKDSTVPLYPLGYYFCVDNNNCIRNSKGKRPNKRYVKSPVDISAQTPEIRYVFNVDFILENPAVLTLFEQSFGKDFFTNEKYKKYAKDFKFSMSKDEYITLGCEEKLKQIIEWVLINNESISFRSWSYLYKHLDGYESSSDYCNTYDYMSERLLFAIKHHKQYANNDCILSQLLGIFCLPVDVARYNFYYKGTPEYSRFKAEEKNKQKKLNRQHIKEQSDETDIS